MPIVRPPTPLLPTSPAYLRLQAARRGTAGGVVFGGASRTFGEIAAAVDELCAWLARRGVGAGSAVGILAANEPAIVAMLYATWGLGAVAVPISARSTAAEAARLLVHARARALLCDPLRADVARDAATAAGVPAIACGPDLPLAPKLLRRGGGGRGVTPRAPTADRLAAIAYTSGSTGAPKGVRLTHANFLWATLACAQARGDGPDGIGACLSPLTHVPVLVSHLLCRILLGARAVLLEKFDVPAVLDAAERFGVTDLPLIGGMVFDVIGLGGVPETVRRSVRKVSVGGAPTPMGSKRALASLFADAEIIEA